MAPSPPDGACVQVDDTFGPYAGRACRGGFDFTLLFEESILVMLPHLVVLLVLPWRFWFLVGRARKVAPDKSLLAHLKILSTLILWVSQSAFRTRTTLAAAVLTLVATIGLCFLSYAEHSRSVRPSSLLNTFLLATLVFDAAHARTLWLGATATFGHAIALEAIVALSIKAVVLLLEATEKRVLLKTPYRSYPREAVGGILNRSFFWWLNPLFFLGYRQVLEIDDLYALDKHLEAARLQRSLQSAWTRALGKTRSSASLLLTCFRVQHWHVISIVPPRVALTALNFCQPFLVHRTITLSQQAIDHDSTQAGYGLIGAYFLVYVGIAVSMGQYQHRTFRSITMLRGGLVSLIYRKTGTLSLQHVDPAASLTLMSADMERIVQGVQTMHEIWANAMEVGVAIYLLEVQLGVACVVPVVVSIVSLLGSMLAMNSIMSSQAMWLEAIEKRISATSSMLGSMKGIKMCGLRDTLLASMQKLRVDELRISRGFRKLLIWNMLFAYTTQVFAPVLTFTVFSVRARDTGDKTLDTARVFTALSLFALLSEPLASLVMALATFLGAVGSFARIQEFLQSSERVEQRVLDNTFEQVRGSGSSQSSGTRHDGDAAISVQAADFGWDATKPPLLSGVTLSIPPRKFTMIIGPVGSGKSLLLQALLGEVPALAGSVRLASSSVAYCAQTPWHTNGTVREAIVGAGADAFDATWYARVVHACALRPDLERLPLGDASRIGSGGIALSGGQSQRLALARAVYARREMVLLDDVLSGLDNATENHVFYSLLGDNGLFRQMGSTVVVVSSSAKRLRYADHIIRLGSKGDMSAQGSFPELTEAGTLGASPGVVTRPDGAKVAPGGDMSLEKTANNLAEVNDKDKDGKASLSTRDTGSSRGDKPVDTSRQTGDVQTYLFYIQSVGWWATIIFFLAILGFVFSVSFPTVWVQWWAAANETEPNGRLGYWLGVYGALGCIAILSLFVGSWQIIVNMVPQSGERFHLALLETVLSAPLSYFVKTDSGETMNRFSQDLQLIDMELPVAALNTCCTLILCLAQMVLIGIGSVYAAISFPVILFVLYFIQRFYLRTSRQLRLMDLEAKAPLYSLFEESLSGLATIRAFGWRDALSAKNEVLLDRSQRPFYLLFAAQRWLTLSLDLLVAGIAVLLVVLVVALRGTTLDAGGIGLALVNVIQFGQTIKLLITFWTTLETHIGSVARVKSFTETTVSEHLPGEDRETPAEWPAQGAIVFDNLSASYDGDALVLKNITMSIAPGEKIAVCGRTGSGKTSLIMALFRIVDHVSSGRVLIDGVDIATLPRQAVRAALVGVPQHPFLLKGSVRLNTDPLGGASDHAIVAALRAVQGRVWAIVAEKGGLDADVDELNLSVGQMQLFCMARAMLRQSSVLVLDEATSSIDAKSEQILSRLLRKNFATHTIISVAHRLDTIMDFDKVAVLEDGQLVEFDSPYALLEAPDSAFGQLYRASHTEDGDCGVVDVERKKAG